MVKGENVEIEKSFSFIHQHPYMIMDCQSAKKKSLYLMIYVRVHYGCLFVCLLDDVDDDDDKSRLNRDDD